MRILIFLILLIPINALAVDNAMVNESIEEIELQDLPKIGMSFTPGMEPGVVISMPEGQPAVIPGYRVRFKGIAFTVGVSCEDNLMDDCSAYPYAEDYEQRAIFIRYIQASDPKFRTPEGSTVGDRWDQTIKKVAKNKITYTAGDSCVLLPSGWYACIDSMSAKRVFDPQARRLMPKKSSKINFYYKSQN